MDTTHISKIDSGIIPYDDHFYIEYLDHKLQPVHEGNAQLKRYTFFQKDKKSKLYPTNTLSKGDKLTCNGKEIKKTSALTLMNGVYKLTDKRGRIYEEILYVNGAIKKHIVRAGSAWHPKHKGKVISEIAEYDYTVFPFRLHYIKYTGKGEIVSNYYIVHDNKTWILKRTEDPISPDTSGDNE